MTGKEKQYRNLRITVEEEQATRICELAKKTGIPVSRMINALIRDGLGSLINSLKAFNINSLNLEMEIGDIENDK